MLEAGGDVAIGITAHAVPAVAVGGRLVDAGGDPVQNATVALTSLDEHAIPPVYFGPEGPHVSAGINPLESVRTDGSGRFVVPGVRQGLYALQAVVRGTGLGTPVVAAGVAEMDVRISAIDSLTINLLPCARMTGRFLFSGLETPDPERSVEMRPDGEDAHLRKGLATTTNSLADGTFVIYGLLGRHRLTVRSSGNWFTVAAMLENGTDIAKWPFDFEAGRTIAGKLLVRKGGRTPTLLRAPAPQDNASRVIGPYRTSALVAPDEAGGTNYRSPAFDPLRNC